MSHFGSRDFLVDVARGKHAGLSIVNKFGHATAAVAGDDLWGGASPYDFFPSGAPLQVDIVSTSADDNGTGTTGALTVMVKGLDENWNLVEEEVELDGLTPIVSMTTTFMRLFRAYVITSGSAETNIGDITV